MVIFSLKLFNNVRKAIAGRRFPHQLAGGVALGVLLGIIPHGNLMALIVLAALLCFKVNHALMGVVAIAVSFVATRLDPYSHQVGEYLLTHPSGSQWAAQAWSLPVVPWTDLNNTVVLGSFVIGSLSVLPLFAICLPLFRLAAPNADSATNKETTGEPETADTVTHTSPAADSVTGHDRKDGEHELRSPRRSTAEDSEDVRAPEVRAPEAVSVLIDQQDAVPPPRFALRKRDLTEPSATDPTTIPIDNVLANEPIFLPIDASEDSDDSPAADLAATRAESNLSHELPTNEQMVSVETRIDVIRMKDFRDDEATPGASDRDVANHETEQPMDEALNYLLRQLRHSQERKAAG
ncbi:TIGR03546 family protein [Stieleria sp. ICT_E10.1]|uniref:TIGR03546 family protein n=1 Tax=Stieleria sedimenti TaxID=2976331 RepID=UPI00217F7A5F|nr:TIGR03546 family protein [Stieleria sedimenti]MCS7469052.1 TIGR03546 family protein [Stieleria sedimenti]